MEGKRRKPPPAETESRLWVRVKPRSSRNRILGWTPDGFLEVQVKAVPERGQANRACAKEIARALGVAPDRVVLEKGQTSRLKAFRVLGLCDEDMRARLTGPAAAGSTMREDLCK